MTAARRPVELVGFEALVTGRRSTLLIDRVRQPPRMVLERLCELVYHAPNHRQTRPWELAVFVGSSRASLGEGFARDLVASSRTEQDPSRLDKIRTKYLRAPAVIVVACRASSDPVTHREDLMAVAAGVQTMLLGASADGLATLWSSPPVIQSPTVNALAGFAEQSEIVAVVYTGYPSQPPPPCVRQPAAIRFLSD